MSQDTLNMKLEKFQEPSGHDDQDKKSVILRETETQLATLLSYSGSFLW